MNTNRTTDAGYFNIADFLVVDHEHDDFTAFSRSMPMTPNYDEPGTANCIQFKIQTGDQQ
ncbi:hypothetical protein [Aeromonas hydrophila]